MPFFPATEGGVLGGGGGFFVGLDGDEEDAGDMDLFLLGMLGESEIFSGSGGHEIKLLSGFV